MLSQRWNCFLVCSAYYVCQYWNGFWFPLMLENWLLVGSACAKIGYLLLSMCENSFGVDSVCDEIVCLAGNEIISAYVQPVHAIIFRKYPTNANWNAIYDYKKTTFLKSLRIPSKRTKVKILQNKIPDTSQKIVSVYAQSRQKCSNIENLAKIEGKKSKFFLKIDLEHLRFRFRYKKYAKLSYACAPVTDSNL
jgi:hypothetical protein